MALGKSDVPGEKAGPHGSFPIGDKKHARLAIGGATRSYNAGNISKSTEEHIKTKAREKLKGTMERMNKGGQHEVHIHNHVHHHAASHEHEHDHEHEHTHMDNEKHLEAEAESREHPIKRKEPHLRKMR